MINHLSIIVTTDLNASIKKERDSLRDSLTLVVNEIKKDKTRSLASTIMSDQVDVDQELSLKDQVEEGDGIRSDEEEDALRY